MERNMDIGYMQLYGEKYWIYEVIQIKIWILDI